MKKALLLVLALVLVIGTMAGCGGKDNTGGSSTPPTNSTPGTSSTTTPGGTDSTSKPAVSGLVSKVGDSVSFGKANGKAIEWICIDVETDSITNKATKALLLSKDILFEMPWDSTQDITEAKWESSTLREYLGNVWVGATFSQVEINLIVTAWNTNPGGGTEDPAFILTTEEIEKYFTTQQSRIAKLTKDGAYDAFDYWTRTPGGSNGEARAELVRFDGEIFKSNDGYIVAGSYGVRPAIWVDITPEN
jgi:predicted small lipoprotein YifL